MSERGNSKRVLRTLAALAKTTNRTVNELRVILALERIAARLESDVNLREVLVFKGGFVLFKLIGSDRFTRDIDVLAMNASKTKVRSMVTRALAGDLSDGITFGDPEIEDLTDQGRYGGYRLKIPFQIGPFPRAQRQIAKLSRVHLDIGFGDVIVGNAKSAALRPLIEGDSPLSWRVYPLESIFAEKLETVVSRGSANSRAKDLFDLVLIFGSVGTSNLLVPAIEKTFANRGTPLPTSFEGHFRSLDVSIFERSWGSVDLPEPKMTFAGCRRRLLGVLRQVDGAMKRKAS